MRDKYKRHSRIRWEAPAATALALVLALLIWMHLMTQWMCITRPPAFRQL